MELQNTTINPDLKTLEAQLNAAFKEKNYTLVRDLAAKIQMIDASNALSKKLLQKLEEEKTKEEAREKAIKSKEYEVMLKKLYKEEDYAKVKDLANEFKTFDPQNKSAEKWIKKAENGGKGFFSMLFGRSKKKEAVIPASATSVSTQSANVKIEASSASTSALPDLKLTPEHVAPKVIVPPTVVASNPPQTASQTVSLPSVAVPHVPQTPKSTIGNTFTKMFGKDKSQDAASIMDRIVAKVDQKQKNKNLDGSSPVILSPQEKKPFNLLGFSKVLMNFTAVFIFMTGSFLYLDYLDKENTVLGFVGFEENTGSKLHKAAEKITEKKKEESKLNKDIALFKNGYADNSIKTVEKITQNRVKWQDIFTKISEVTNSVYELNDFFKYIEYNNYSFDAEKGTIRVSGTLSDPQGRNLTKLVELEEAFQYFPKDKNNAEDPTKPYFKGLKELTSFTKSLNEVTGRYVSNFQLSFALN